MIDHDRDLLVLLRRHVSNRDGFAGARDLCLGRDGEHAVGRPLRLWIDDSDLQFADLTRAAARLRVRRGLQRNNRPVVGHLMRGEERRRGHEGRDRQQLWRGTPDAVPASAAKGRSGKIQAKLRKGHASRVGHDRIICRRPCPLDTAAALQ